MSNRLQTIGLTLFIFLSVVTIGIGFLFGIDNPVPWIMIGVLLVLPYVHRKLTARRFVAWSQALELKIGPMDADHQRLIALINDLQTAVLYATGETFERQALKEVVDYTQGHFQREEALLAEHAYPDLEEHKRLHAEMIERVGQFLAAYEKDRAATVDKLTNFLKTWLVEHIAGVDHKYGPYLRERGVS